MSSEPGLVAATSSGPYVPPVDWPLVRRQLAGILRLEIRGTLFSRRMVAVYFLAFAPVLLIAVWSMTSVPQHLYEGPREAARSFAYFFASYVGISLFLSSVILFTSLFRNEIQEKTLHYYFLAPVRRGVLVASKYIAGLLAIVGVYGIGTVLFYLLMIWPWGLDAMSRFLMRDGGLGHLMSYLLITALASIGYGALFLLTGLLVRNPIIIALLVWGWEFINSFLPALLQKISVAFYLKSLNPIPLPEAQLSIISEPVSPWLAIPGLLIVSAGFLALATWRARTMEIKYGGQD